MFPPSWKQLTCSDTNTWLRCYGQIEACNRLEVFRDLSETMRHLKSQLRC